MREKDLEAIIKILYWIKSDRLLEPGINESLNMFNYSDLDTLYKEFERVFNAVKDTDCAMVRCGVLKEIQFYTWDIEKEVRPKLAVARSYSQFMEYCIKNGLDYFDIVYISDRYKVRGFRDCEMLLIGDYWRSLDFCPIFEYCDSHNIKRTFCEGE